MRAGCATPPQIMPHDIEEMVGLMAEQHVEEHEQAPVVQKEKRIDQNPVAMVVKVH